MSDHHVVCSTVLSTLSSSFSAYFKIRNATFVSICLMVQLLIVLKA